MRRRWVGATAEILLAGPTLGRGRRRVRNRYAVTDEGLVEVCSHEELLASLPPDTATAPGGAAAVEHYETPLELRSTEEITTI